MRTRKDWWLTLISVGMVTCGVAAVWSLVGQRSHVYDAVPFVISALIAVVGAISLLKEITRQPGDDSPCLLAPSIEPYVLAWRRLWNTRWLLGVYGCVAGVSIVGSLFNQICWHLWYSRMTWPYGTAGSGGALDSAAPLERFLVLLHSLPQWVHRGGLDKFVPRISTMGAIPVMPIAILLVVLWALSRLPHLSREPEYSGNTHFFGACLVLLLCACAVTTVMWFQDIRAVWETVSKAAAPAGPATLAQLQDVVFPGRRQLSPWYPNLAGIVIGIIVNAVFMGAVIGSLARSRRGHNDVKATFLGDAVRYFIPLAGIYLVFWLPALLGLTGLWLPGFYWPASLLFVLLMYAPMGVVTQNLGFFAAIRHNLRVWKDIAWRTILLIATGSFLSVLVMGPVDVIDMMIHLSFPKGSWPPVLMGQVFAVVGIAISALIFLAVWEFYSAQVLERRDSLQEQR